MQRLENQNCKGEGMLSELLNLSFPLLGLGQQTEMLERYTTD